MKKFTAVIPPVFTLSALAGSAPLGLGRQFLPAAYESAHGYSVVSGVADVDGDGITDLLISSSQRDGNGLYGVAFGEPGGGFVFSDPIDLWGPLGLMRAACGDTDGDGVGEFIVLTRDEMIRTPFIGRTAQKPIVTELPWSHSVGKDQADFGVDDLDADGVDDVVYIDYEGDLHILWSGGGSSSVPLPEQDYEMHPVADYNGDGRPDLLLLRDQNPHMLLIVGTGSQTLGSPVEISVLSQSGVFADIDGNGLPDYVYRLLDQVLCHYDIGVTPGNPPVVLDAPEGIEIWGVTGTVELEPGAGSDLLVRAYRSHILTDIMLWTRPGHEDARLFQLGSVAIDSRDDGVFLAVDPDGDGRNDLVVGDHRITTFFNRNCPVPTPLSVSTVDMTSSLALHTIAEDLNGDGRAEMVTVHGTLLTLTSGDPAAGWVNQTVDIPGGGWMAAAADPEGDGSVWIVCASTRGSLWSFRTEGGVLTPGQVITLADPAALYSIAAADLDGDGADEVVAMDRSGFIRIFGADGEGVLAEVAAIPVPSGISLVAADMNNDGLPDLVMGDEVGEAVIVFVNAGGMSFVPQAPIPVGEWPYWIEAADIDADGHMDLVVGRQVPSVWWGLGNLNFSAPQPLVSTGDQNYFSEILAVDLNDDGLLDIVLPHHNYFDGNTSGVLVQTSPRVFESPSPLIGSEHTGVGAGDINGDGAVDVVAASHSSLLEVHWGTPEPCPADMNGDCALNFFDVAAFLSAFESQEPAADFAEPFGAWNFFDVSAFLGAYGAGCP